MTDSAQYWQASKPTIQRMGFALIGFIPLHLIGFSGLQSISDFQTGKPAILTLADFSSSDIGLFLFIYIAIQAGSLFLSEWLGRIAQSKIIYGVGATIPWLISASYWGISYKPDRNFAGVDVAAAIEAKYDWALLACLPFIWLLICFAPKFPQKNNEDGFHLPGCSSELS